MKDKIVLLYPKFYKVEFDASSVPLGILSIGTILKQQGCRVKIVDFIIEDYPYSILENELDETVLAVGISVMTPQIPHALELSAKVKAFDQALPVIWGGIHPTLFPEQTMRNTLIDYVIKGEGELSFPKLLKAIKGEMALHDVSGLVHRRKEEIVINKETELIDLNDLPMMDYSLLSPKVMENKMMILNTSRGCPFECTFCVNISLHNRRWRFQNAEKILDQVEYVLKTLKFKSIKFQEDNFFVSKDRVITLIEGIKKRGLDFKWYTSCRVDFFRDDYITDEMLRRLKEVGLYRLNFGAESGSERVLGYIKKRITVDQIIQAAEVCQRHDIKAAFSFMCALPTETREERMMTLHLIDRLMKIGSKILIMSPQPYRPYPGDILARECEELGFKFPDKLEDWKEVVAKSLDSSTSNLENFPWIKAPNEIRLQRVCSIIETSRKSTRDYIKRYPIIFAPVILLFYWIEKLRWRLKFFGLPLEYSIFMKFYWWTQKLRKSR